MGSVREQIICGRMARSPFFASRLALILDKWVNSALGRRTVLRPTFGAAENSRTRRTICPGNRRISTHTEYSVKRTPRRARRGYAAPSSWVRVSTARSTSPKRPLRRLRRRIPPDRQHPRLFPGRKRRRDAFGPAAGLVRSNLTEIEVEQVAGGEHSAWRKTVLQGRGGEACINAFAAANGTPGRRSHRPTAAPDHLGQAPRPAAGVPGSPWTRGPARRRSMSLSSARRAYLSSGAETVFVTWKSGLDAAGVDRATAIVVTAIGVALARRRAPGWPWARTWGPLVRRAASPLRSQATLRIAAEVAPRKTRPGSGSPPTQGDSPAEAFEERRNWHRQSKETWTAPERSDPDCPARRMLQVHANGDRPCQCFRGGQGPEREFPERRPRPALATLSGLIDRVHQRPQHDQPEGNALLRAGQT